MSKIHANIAKLAVSLSVSLSICQLIRPSIVQKEYSWWHCNVCTVLGHREKSSYSTSPHLTSSWDQIRYDKMWYISLQYVILCYVMICDDMTWQSTSILVLFLFSFYFILYVHIAYRVIYKSQILYVIATRK